MTIQELAKQVCEYFEQATRTSGETFIRTIDGTPEWVHDMCREAHGDMLPDDTKYEFIVKALDAIADSDDVDNARDELEPDAYNIDRLRWLSSHLERAGYVDEAVQQGFVNTDEFSVIDAIGAGQVLEIQEVFDSVRQALETHLEEDEETEEDE